DVNANSHGQSRFGCGENDNEQRGNLAVDATVTKITIKRDQIHRRAVQDKLNADQNADGIALGHHGEEAATKENGSDDEILSQADSHFANAEWRIANDE